MKQFIIILKGDIIISICSENFIKRNDSIHFIKDSDYISSIFIKDISKMFEYQGKEKIQIKL